MRVSRVSSIALLLSGYLGLLLLALALRVPTLARESFWRDEVDAVLFASAPWPTLIGAFALPQHNGPGYHLLLRLWIDAAGTSEFAVRYFSTLADLLGLVLVVALGRRVGGTAVAGLAGLVWAVLPATLWYAREGKMYAPLAVVAALCLYLSATAVERRSPVRAAAALAVAAVGVYIHFFAGLLVAPAVFALVASAVGAGWRGFRVGRGPLVGLAGAALVGAAVAADVLPREWGTLTRAQWTGHPFVPLGDLLPKVLFGITLNTPPLPGVIPAALLLSALFAGGLAVGSEDGRVAARRAAVFWLFLALPLAVFYVVSFHLPLFAERYFVVLLPALVLLLARGLVAIEERSRLIGLPVAALVLLLLVSLQVQQRTASTKADYRTLGAYLREAARPGDGLMVVMPYNARSVDFYVGAGLVAVEPPPAPSGIGDDILEAQAGARVAPFGRLWLVRAESDQYDPDGAIARWLGQRSRLAASHSWNGVRVDLFESVAG